MSKTASIILYSAIFFLVFAAAIYYKTQQSDSQPSIQKNETVIDTDKRFVNNKARPDDENESSSSKITDESPNAIETFDSAGDSSGETENEYDGNTESFNLSNDQEGYMQYMQSQGSSATDNSASEDGVESNNNYDSNSNPLVDNSTPGRRFGTISEGTVESKNINKYYPGRSNKINPWALQEFYGTPANLPKNQPPSQEFQERKNRLKDSINQLRQQAGQ